jgi:hypothetical protein
VKVEQLLDEARVGLKRVTPAQALEAMRSGQAVVVDMPAPTISPMASSK